MGIGFAANMQKVKVVEMLSKKPIMVTRIGHTEDGATTIEGQVIDKSIGIYALRIVSHSNLKKEIAVSGPAQIEFNKSTGEFSATLKTQGIENLFHSQDDPKYVEIYIQDRQVDKIKYGAEANQDERINVGHLKISNRLPLEYFPDPRTIIEDDADR